MIPEIVRKQFGKEYSIEKVGEYQGSTFYHAYIPDAKTGFPQVAVLSKNGDIKVIEGFLALDVLSSFE